ncbi:MAG: putative addiction module antidote protein [Cardiobacteriaceae bacterium]|nr:putative addiction module antidote protein [Cardiobacteriaceae bacterium]
MTHFSPLNPAELLNNQQEINEFLADAFNDENPDIFIAALGNVIKTHGLAAIAKKTQIDQNNLTHIINGDEQPSWRTMHKLMHNLNIVVNVDTSLQP